MGLLFDSSSCCELCVMFSCVPGIDSLMAPKLERFLFWDGRTDGRTGGQEFLWNSGEALLRSTQFKFGFSFSQCYDGCEKLKTKLGFATFTPHVIFLRRKMHVGITYSKVKTLI